LGKSFRNWSQNENKLARVRALLALIAGIITTIVGYGAWRSPHLDWITFRNAFEQLLAAIFNEIFRMMINPFTFVGLIVMIVGLFFTMNSARKLLPN